MSRDNVEVVQRGFEALARRDLSGMEHVFADDGEWRPLLTAGGDLERPVYRGPEGMAKYWADLDELFEDTQMHMGSLDPVGPNHVLFSGRVTARGRQSGVPLDEQIWAVYELREGRLVRGTAYRSQEEALEALPQSG